MRGALTRLKMSYEAVKRRTEAYTKIMEELPQMRRETVHMARQAGSAKADRPMCWSTIEGNAPLTVQALAEMLRD